MRGISSIKEVVLLFIIITVSFQPNQASTRDTTRGLAVELRISRGFIIQHHLDMGVYTNRHFPCFELNVARPGKLGPEWKQYYAYPVFGLAYWYSDLGNTKILGDVHALFVWGRFPLISQGKSVINFRFGCGIGYFQKIFDRYENYKNLAIGSHLNANLQLYAEYRNHLSEKLDLAAGIGLAHFSNGAMITPNYGINVPHASLVLSFGKGNKFKSVKSSKPDSFDKHWDTYGMVSNGIKEIMPVMGETYLVFSASVDHIYQRSPKGGIGAGIDLYWDGSERTILKRLKSKNTTDFGLLKPGLKGIKQWNMGKLKLNFEIGIYLYEKESSDGSVYDKISLQYFITNHFFVLTSLKTHFARADFIGWGVGVKMKEEGRGKREKVKVKGRS